MINVIIPNYYLCCIILKTKKVIIPNQNEDTHIELSAQSRTLYQRLRATLPRSLVRKRGQHLVMQCLRLW